MLLLEHRKQGVSTAVIHNIWRITAEGESGRRVCSFSIISLHGTDLDLQGFCQLGHNNIIAYGTTPFQHIILHYKLRGTLGFTRSCGCWRRYKNICV